MASQALRLPVRTTSSNPLDKCKQTTLSFSFSFTAQHQQQRNSDILISHPDLKPPPKSRFFNISPRCSISSSPIPPATREEAILQAKTSLSSTLEKPLNNPKVVAGKLKKLKQPRLRVEVPVIDESPGSLSELALEIFTNMNIKRKGANIKILILWPSQTLTQAAVNAFSTHSAAIVVQNAVLSSVLDANIRILNSADVAVFMAPEESQLTVIKRVCDSCYPKPVVFFNPKWSFEEEINFGELSGFVGSFEVVYSFTGLEVRGILSKRKGVIFKCVRDGVLSGEKWNVLVEEEDGELRVVSRFALRPSIVEVENALYNLMAINSPVTKSAKFLKGLLSNITGKK